LQQRIKALLAFGTDAGEHESAPARADASDASGESSAAPEARAA
jgi:hypothetical protein